MSKPRNTYPISGLKVVYAIPHCQNDTYDLVPRDEGNFWRSQVPVYDVQVRATDAASANLE
jgi:hypothetical protein